MTGWVEEVDAGREAESAWKYKFSYLNELRTRPLSCVTLNNHVNEATQTLIKANYKQAFAITWLFSLQNVKADPSKWPHGSERELHSFISVNPPTADLLVDAGPAASKDIKERYTPPHPTFRSSSRARTAAMHLLRLNIATLLWWCSSNCWENKNPQPTPTPLPTVQLLCIIWGIHGSIVDCSPRPVLKVLPHPPPHGGSWGYPSPVNLCSTNLESKQQKKKRRKCCRFCKLEITMIFF